MVNKTNDVGVDPRFAKLVAYWLMIVLAIGATLLVYGMAKLVRVI